MVGVGRNYNNSLGVLREMWIFEKQSWVLWTSSSIKEPEDKHLVVKQLAIAACGCDMYVRGFPPQVSSRELQGGGCDMYLPGFPPQVSSRELQGGDCSLLARP